jgi:phosphoacetylglucosamine mutase
MITASHNPAQDNGVKLVDPNGQMLPMDCEQKLTEIVNASAEEFAKYQAVARRFTDKTQEEQMTRTIVVIATDTRQSSPTLCQEAMIGVEKLGAPFEVRLFG